MKKIALIVLGIFVIVIGILGIIAPSTFLVEKSVVIDKPRDFVFDKIKYLKLNDEWNPWSKKDRNMKREYKGVDGTVGFISSWAGNSKVGVGEQEIKRILEGERIDYELRFKGPMNNTNQSYMTTVAASDTQTKVTWGMTGKMTFPGNIIFMIISMEKKLGYDFDEGLAVLKAILEKDPAT